MHYVIVVPSPSLFPRLLLPKVMAVTDSASGNLWSLLSFAARATDQERWKTSCVVCVNFACQFVVAQCGEVTRVTDCVPPLSGKQNGCAIKCTFRWSACPPSLLTANLLVLTAGPQSLLLCIQPQQRWISPKSLAVHGVYWKDSPAS